jgi:agmatinase
MSEYRASADLFLAAVRSPAADTPSRCGLVGVPYDGAVTYRSGARGGPAGVRAASDSIETYCPLLDRDLADTPPLDFGDLRIPADPASGRAVVDDLRRQLELLADVPLLAIGGDHLVAYPFLARALERHPELQVFHIDAHTDLRAEWEGEPFNHASVLRRVLEVMPATARLHEWGIRSGLREEFRLADEDPRIVRHANTAAAGLALATALRSSGTPVYITLDVDGIDPAQFPGTGTPEPGGLDYRAVEDALVALAGANLVGADLVEIAPGLDPTGISAVAGARLARTLLLLLAHPRS